MESGIDVQVRVLGEIAVVDADEPVAMPPQLRRLLALLIVADGSSVSADRLAEYVADGNVSGSTVRTAVSRLRKVLGERVESAPGGYRLVIDADELDAARFEQLLERARAGDGDARIGALSTALELWGGRALGDLADEEWAAPWAARLQAARVGAVEDLGDALADAGRHRGAVELLEEHVREHPYRERPVGLLMRSLHADGRTADALRTFETFRVTLRDDTGLDPSPELRGIQSEILAATAEQTPVQEWAAERRWPEGTVTFLFTDIEGSTQRWAKDEDAMTDALQTHDAALREVVSDHDGIVFKHTGDGVCAVFASAPAAVAAARNAQDRLALPVRIGIHTGDAELRDGDYFGPTLNRVARIMDAGHGGQILMSQATSMLVDDVDARDLGEHRLKGLSTPERIVQVGTVEFPALRVATAQKGNLPIEFGEFVGRGDELADLAARATDHRLVTLIGIGGTGKTRLAIETATTLAPTFPDGCWITELAPVTVTGAVPIAIARSLGVTIPESGDVLDHVIGRVRHQRRLLIVDNCEHVLTAAADAIERLLDECPALTIIATSRESLMVRGEQILPVGSLSHHEAVTLFRTRASDEAPDTALDEQQLDAIGQLCERLDRLPLAIELAAARLRVMTPVEMLAGLDARFRLLAGGRRSRMERHQTMRGTLDWSYELCDPLERSVFDAVSVFTTAFDLDAAHAIADPDAQRFDIADALARLVERSMIQRVTADDGTSRHVLLETMRAYGRENLADQELTELVSGRHAEHIATTVSRLGLECFGPDERAVRDELRRIVPEMVPALDWFIDHENWLRAIRITAFPYALEDRLMVELCRRLADGLEEAGVPFDALPPHERCHVEMWNQDERSMWTDGSASILEAAQDTIFGEQLLTNDCFLTSPFLAWIVKIGDEHPEWPDVVEHLSIVDDASPVVRYYAHYAVASITQQSQIFSPTPLESPGIMDQLDVIIDELGSEDARRQALGLRSLAAQDAGDYEAALRFATRALPRGDCLTLSDLNNACRRLRALGALRRRPNGDDLRLVWRGLIDGGYLVSQFNALHSTAVALDAIEYVDLADRLMARARGTGMAAPHWSVINRAIPGALAERVLDVVPSDESIEALARAVFDVADELDRQAV